MNIKATGNAKIDSGLAHLRRALVTLDSEHQVGGRNASRRRVAAAIKKIQKTVDVQFPAKRAKGKKRVRLTDVLRIRRLETAGWRYLKEGRGADAYASAGVAVRHFEADIRKLDNGSPSIYRRAITYVPAWAFAIGPDAKKLRQAGRSTQRKQAALAEAALLKS